MVYMYVYTRSILDELIEVFMPLRSKNRER